jgi:hypothetical protein
MRDDVKRRDKYQAKTSAATVNQKVAARLARTKTSYASLAAAIYAQELQAQGILQSATPPQQSPMFPFYLTYVRQLAKRARNGIHGPALAEFTEGTTEKWTSAGLDASTLADLARDIFGVIITSAHHATHEDGGSDEIQIELLPTSENDTSLRLAPDGAGGLQWSAGASEPTLKHKTDFIGLSGADSTCSPWFTAGNANGAWQSIAGVANHPGIWGVNTWAYTGGVHCVLEHYPLLLAGRESTTIIFRPLSITDIYCDMGFLDSDADGGSPDSIFDGAFLQIRTVGGIPGTLLGKTRTNSVESTTGTGYVVAPNTWYQAKIVVNDDATRIDYYLYSEAGALLWSDYLTTNIPTATGRETGNGIVLLNLGAGRPDWFNVDYLSFDINRTMNRI